MSLSLQFLDELRSRTLLSALVGRTTKLQKAGREYRACCPFHNEKTPSFYVNDDKGFYHCFGCSAHGDAIRWLTEQRGLPFMDAVKELAAAAGMELPALDRQSVEKAERAKGLHDVMADAAAWFTAQLGDPGGKDARGLLERRGVTPDTARAFGIGYAPDTRGGAKTALATYGDPMLVEAGLLIQVDDKAPYDRFRGRLMIPIRDPRGRTIAFGGRVIGSGEPKYLNSPDTPLFDKGRTLYNLDRAAGPARKSGRVIVVEGYMDVIALAQAGITEVVAPLGTALTEAQLERLWRLAEVPLLCFDGDAAGQKAALRAAHRALPLLAPSHSLAFVMLPPGQDPDDLIRASGGAAFEALVERAEPLVERLWQSEVAAAPLATPEARAGLKARLVEHANAIADRDVRDNYLAEFRSRLVTLFAPPPRAPFVPRAKFVPRGARPMSGPPSANARTINAGGIDRILAKAVLAGLIRHPAEIARHVEILGALRMADGALARLFEAVVDVALEDSASGEALDSAHLVTILAKSGFDGIASELLRADTLPFSFTRKGADPAIAHADLNEAIAVMVAGPELDAALAAATIRASEDEGAFVEQQRLRAARSALESRLANLMTADEDGETLNSEGS